MKKHFLVGVYVCTFLNACNYYGTEAHKKIYTPSEFLNDAYIPKIDYSTDSLILLNALKVELKNHRQSFHREEYFDSTELLIDTIVYNSAFDRLGVFVIAKNPTYRQRVPDENHDWYYDATSYLGLKRGDSVVLSWLGPNFDNFEDPKEVSKMIRVASFEDFARKDTEPNRLYKYNLNDKRFWDGPIWKNKFDTLIK